MTDVLQELMLERWPRLLLANEKPPTDPEEAIGWMNARCFVVSEAGKTGVITEEIDPELSRRVLRRSAFEDIKKLHCNRKVHILDNSGAQKHVELGKYWLGHEDRRQYKGIVCNPAGKDPRYYNLWQGFSVEPRQGDWSLLDDHIQKNICSGDAEVYSYVRNWLAFAVQCPETLPEVALVMRGKQGTGKGVFARAFGELFGQHFLHLARSRNLVGNFNAHLRDAIVVFADEAFLAGDTESEGVLKAMITERELSIEQKFKDMVMCRNLIHLIVASNNDRIINAAAEERRFCVLDVSDARMQDLDYFAAIKAQMDAGGREAMLYDLQREDLKAFNPRKFPMTSGLQDQKLRSMNRVDSWWFKRLQSGCLLADDGLWPAEVLRGELLTAYRGGTGQKDDQSQDLGNALRKLLPEGYPKNGSRPTVAGKRERTWIFPSLEECRSHFAELFKMLDSWPDAGSDVTDSPVMSIGELIGVQTRKHVLRRQRLVNVQPVQDVQPDFKQVEEIG